MTPGEVVLVKSWDGKTRPAIFLEIRGGEAVTLPFTSDYHVVRNGKAAHVAEWKQIGLHRESWLWNFLQRVNCDDLEPTKHRVTRDLAQRVAALFGSQLQTATVVALTSKPERASA